MANNANTPKKDFFETIYEKLEDLVKLEITTVVAKLETKNGKLEYADNQTVEGMVSTINLIDGDTETKITEKFATEYEQLREFHMLKERQGLDIIQKNLDVVEKIGKMAIKFKDNGKVLQDELKNNS
ncbi:MAG: hypothetical protein N4A74_22530 [Carboxylicivirga sp.]|jgi:paraquat-inducible protein B|nr:hypothetical protein [Carboxylicivirga sp.]